MTSLSDLQHQLSSTVTVRLHSGEQRLGVLRHQHVAPPAGARAESGARPAALEGALAHIPDLLIAWVVAPGLVRRIAVPGAGNT